VRSCRLKSAEKVAKLASEIKETAREIASVATGLPSQQIPRKAVRALDAASELVAGIEQYHMSVRRLRTLQQRRAKDWHKRLKR
jgi:hypothetical protein